MKKQLFKPYTFPHGATMKNHFALAPMTTYSSNQDLTLSTEEEVYYNSRAKEFGMIITAATAVSKNAQAFEHQISIRDERYLDSMTRLANSIKQEGALAVIQLHHGGRMNKPGLYPNQDIVSASAIKADREYAATPRKLKISEVHDVIDEFVNATILAIKAGFDGIELHGANTYLIQQFFSPHSNRRDDEFGGSLQRRLTFPLRLVDRVIEAKQNYGKPEFIIGYRLSPEEREDPGITLDDTLRLVDELCHKDIDYIHLSQGYYKNTSIRDQADKRVIVDAIQNVVQGRVSLIGAGGINTMDNAEDALIHGYDLVALGTVALADPYIITHFEQGKEACKIIGEESILPSPLLHRLRSWKGLEQKGYIIK
ncbi:NADH-dependent flavin oxidoreductase [Candidatus Xianfuyuplasma coldseepsis]|uniref:NADH-dependent flavin oxidoreductase n=1 Tax=Candidatus Xianfuyuplasma coldseepsis TaxID=2782163 RepID=A0A7L7KTS4_9MOLU|nr:NADH-dependent flavin oxidoreductase [Xianfuyuplasma coldseepsis]QMS85656.1 NADH-dependent flavin oxidoreductase [Xianfuyuplasma coldseepsis]